MTPSLRERGHNHHSGSMSVRHEESRDTPKFVIPGRGAPTQEAPRPATSTITTNTSGKESQPQGEGKSRFFNSKLGSPLN